MVEKPPFPDDGTRHVYFHQRIHLGIGVAPAAGGIAAGGDALVETDGFVGDVEGRAGLQLGVEDSQEVVVRRIIGARFRVLPDDDPVPVDLGKSAKSAGIIFRSIEHVAIGEQVGIRADRPGVDHPPLHIHQIRRAAHAKPGVTVIGVGLVPI